jgi:hypothetical protein
VALKAVTIPAVISVFDTSTGATLSLEEPFPFLIVIVVICVIVGLVCLIILAVCLIRRQKRRDDKSSFYTQLVPTDNRQQGVPM